MIINPWEQYTESSIQIYNTKQKSSIWIEINKKKIQLDKNETNETAKTKQNNTNSNKVLGFNATFNNIAVISWRSVLLMEETGVSGGNHRPAASHWQTLSHNVVQSTSRLLGFELRTLVAIGTDCIVSYKSHNAANKRASSTLCTTQIALSHRVLRTMRYGESTA